MSSRQLDHANLDNCAPADRIDMICDVFDQAWRSDKCPRIEDFLAKVTADEQPLLLQELLATEFEYRRKRREAVTLEPYLKRFPQFQTIVERFAAVDASKSMILAIDSLQQLFTESTPTTSLPTSRLFSAVPADVLQSRMTYREFGPNEYLLREGQEASSLMVICDGSVGVSTEDSDGNCHVIGHAGPGQMLGEMSLLTSQPCTASAVAVDRACVLSLPAETFHQLSRQYPELSVIMTDVVASRLGQSGRDALTDKCLDRYRIRGRLGRGGMGIVYQAEDTVHHDRVALKMLSHHLVYCEEALERFRREADIIESFDHPNIVRMRHQFTAFHTCFIAMEFCPGQDLQEFLQQRGRLDSSTFHHLIGQLASALLYAHRANVVHRDIKPANIMVTAEGTLKLTDFGLAEPVAEQISNTGRIFGTPRFMAPEQRLGQSAGKEADYFALGCVAYEMLTGEPLFRDTIADELHRDFTTWQPPEFKVLRPDLPQETCRHLQPALEPDVSRRRLNLEQIAAWS